jgi:hypothetical protein
MAGGDDVDSAFGDLLQEFAGKIDYTLDETLLRDILVKEWNGHIKPNFQVPGSGSGPQYHSIPVSSDVSQPTVAIPTTDIAGTFSAPLAALVALIDAQVLNVEKYGLRLEVVRVFLLQPT